MEETKQEAEEEARSTVSGFISRQPPVSFALLKLTFSVYLLVI